MEEEEVQVPVVKVPAGETAKMDTDEVPSEAAAEVAAASSSSNNADVDMQDAKASVNGPGMENSNAETEDKPVQMDTDFKVGIHNWNIPLILELAIRSQFVSLILCQYLVVF